MDEPLPDLPEDEQADWKMTVDLRAAQNLSSSPVALDPDDPLAIRMPSTFVEISHSPTLLYDPDTALKQFSETQYNTNCPNWNQQMTLEGDYLEGKSSVEGSFWLKIYDQQV